MRKTKLLTSLAAFVLVLGLGACETTSEEETTPDESETTTETTDTSESTPSTGTDEGDNDGETQQATLLGSFNFATNEKNGVGISSSSDLDEFWTGDADLYRGISEYDTVYLGNGTNGAFADVTTLIKLGTGSANGKLQLKFAAGTCISEVVVTAHSWYKISDEYPTQEPNQLVVNGTSQDCSVSGTATELRYEITDDLERYVTFESVGRVTIHSIDFYGTYEPEKLETVTLSLSAATTELMVGASTDVSVSYLPEDAIFDEEDLVWSSSDETIASVDNGTVTGVAGGEATISATSSLNSAITASIEFTITEATAKILTYSYTFKSGDLGANSTGSVQGQRSTAEGVSESLNGLTWSYSAALYKGFDNSNNKGIQIGAGNATEAQKTDPFTISTDFGETVKLVSITLNLGTASSGGGKYSINLGSNAVATDVAFTTAAITPYTHDNLSVEGQKLEISLLSTADKAIYIQGLSFTIEADLNTSLNFGE